MGTDTLAQIAVLLAFSLVWMFVNLKAGATWLKVVSLWAMIGFLGAASVLAVTKVFGIL